MDTTVASGTSIFKPTWDMVMGYKHGTLTWEQYTQLYYEKMNTSWKNPKERPLWMGTIESKEPLAIGCMCRYEGPHTHCHRFLLNELFEKLCSRYSIPYFYYGELTE